MARKDGERSLLYRIFFKDPVNEPAPEAPTYVPYPQAQPVQPMLMRSPIQDPYERTMYYHNTDVELVIEPVERKTIYCKQCGQKNEDMYSFCVRCGKSLT